MSAPVVLAAQPGSGVQKVGRGDHCAHGIDHKRVDLGSRQPRFDQPDVAKSALAGGASTRVAELDHGARDGHAAVPRVPTHVVVQGDEIETHRACQRVDRHQAAFDCGRPSHVEGGAQRRRDGDPVDVDDVVGAEATAEHPDARARARVLPGRCQEHDRLFMSPVKTEAVERHGAEEVCSGPAPHGSLRGPGARRRRRSAAWSSAARQGPVCGRHGTAFASAGRPAHRARRRGRGVLRCAVPAGRPRREVPSLDPGRDHRADGPLRGSVHGRASVGFLWTAQSGGLRMCGATFRVRYPPLGGRGGRWGAGKGGGGVSEGAIRSGACLSVTSRG